MLRQGQGVPATQVVPPGMTGHDPTFDGRARYDSRGANALLDKFGYKRPRRRRLPRAAGRQAAGAEDASTPIAQDRQYDELWQRSLDALGLRVEFIKQKWPTS